MRIKPAGKIILLILVLGVAFGIFRAIKGPDAFSSLLPGAKSQDSTVPIKIDLQQFPGQTTPTNASLGFGMPASDGGCTNDPEVRMLGYAWNAQMGIHFATGGAQATANSRMCAHGVNFKWNRQDDNGKLTEALVAFATELSKGNANPATGAHFVTVMGDGSAVFLKGANDALKRLGSEYTAKVIGAAGYSRGEDKFMGPVDWKENPIKSKGGVCAGVVRDGDWNIAQKWLGDNSLRTNPDEKTYDPDALNWVNASDYIDAAQKYIAGYSEDRPVVRNGKRTGETKHITVNSVVTWTPGDVQVAQNKGGLVSIVSTKEYNSQMPCVIIGIDKWMKANKPTVEGMLQAIAEGGEAVRSSSQALHRAAEISAANYNEKGSDADYWEKYYKGTRENDKQGERVDLGGSSSSDMTDMMYTFGLVPGSANLFAATYKVFGDLVASQYPNLMPGTPSVDSVMDSPTSRMWRARQVVEPRARLARSIPTWQEEASRMRWLVTSTGTSRLRAVERYSARVLSESLSGFARTFWSRAERRSNSTVTPTTRETRAGISNCRKIAPSRWLIGLPSSSRRTSLRSESR